MFVTDAENEVTKWPTCRQNLGMKQTNGIDIIER